MAKYNVHAGHTSATGKSPGAVSLLNESIEDRIITKKVIELLKADGNTVYDCTAEGNNASDNLYKIVQKCNTHAVDLDVSIHFNSGAKDKSGNGKTCGTEVWICPGGNAIKKATAARVCKNMSALGFTNRGVKESSNLYVLNRSNSPAVLIEVCFTDDKDDYTLYKKLGYKTIAKAIAEGIVGHKIERTYETLCTMNIREKATTKSEIVGKLAKGVTVTGIPDGRWLKTSKGYVAIKGTIKTYLKEK